MKQLQLLKKSAGMTCKVVQIKLLSIFTSFRRHRQV